MAFSSQIDQSCPDTTPQILKMDRVSGMRLSFFEKKPFLPAVVDLDVDPAVSNGLDGPLPQRVVAGASSSRGFGDGIAAHHGAAADINRFADFELFEIGPLGFVAAGGATQDKKQNDQDGYPFFHGTLGQFKRQSLHGFCR